MVGKAIVVWGGIAGLSAAIGFERVGWQVAVFEWAEPFQPVGAGLRLAPNEVRAVDWLGLGDQVRSRGWRRAPPGQGHLRRRPAIPHSAAGPHLGAGRTGRAAAEPAGRRGARWYRQLVPTSVYLSAVSDALWAPDAAWSAVETR
jgi:glycine/D-amino acid oxidase-like deaminating enzyme